LKRFHHLYLYLRRHGVVVGLIVLFLAAIVAVVCEVDCCCCLWNTGGDALVMTTADCGGVDGRKRIVFGTEGGWRFLGGGKDVLDMLDVLEDAGR
jgi:hypothetical protein